MADQTSGLDRINELLNRITELNEEELNELRDLIIEELDVIVPTEDEVPAADLSLLESLAAAADAYETETQRRQHGGLKRDQLNKNLNTFRSRMQVPFDRRPYASRSSSMVLTASGLPMGDDNIAREMIDAMLHQRNPDRTGRVLVASVAAREGIAPRVSATNNAEQNTEIFRAVREGVNAVTAAGGFGAPAQTLYDLPSFGEVADRPLRDAFPLVVTDRGAIRFNRNLTLADLQPSASVWTVADDIAALEGDGPRKPHHRVPFGDEVQVDTQAIVSILRSGNLNARAYAEHVQRQLELANVAHAQLAEQQLLATLNALSVPVTVAAGDLGATRHVLPSLAIAAAGIRSRNRLAANAPLDVVLPATFRDVVKIDLARQHPGDNALALTDNEVDALFKPYNLRPVYSLDHQVVGAQAPNTPLVSIEDDLVAYICAPGSVVFLDGGTLDLGIIRDSVLNASNDYEIFFETFEALVVTGMTPTKLTLAGTVPSGATRAAV